MPPLDLIWHGISGPPCRQRLPLPPSQASMRRLTGLCEAAGYACVIYCIKQSGTASLFGPFVAKQLFLLLSPNLLQACVCIGGWSRLLWYEARLE